MNTTSCLPFSDSNDGKLPKFGVGSFFCSKEQLYVFQLDREYHLPTQFLTRTIKSFTRRVRYLYARLFPQTQTRLATQLAQALCIVSTCDLPHHGFLLHLPQFPSSLSTSCSDM